MRIMRARETDAFNEQLRRWRAEGRKIGWAELREAADLAWGEGAAEGQAERPASKQARGR